MMRDTTVERATEIFSDKQWLPYNEWVKKYPEYAQWLSDNGFVYVEELDRGRGDAE